MIYIKLEIWVDNALLIFFKNSHYYHTFDIKFVYCPLYTGKSLVKSNKKNKKMLRFDLCYALIFANYLDNKVLNLKIF